MKKNLFLAALAFVALASCTSDEFVGGNTSPTTSGNADGAILFESSTPRITRATGSTAAAALDYKFKVYATKTVSSATSNVFASGAYSDATDYNADPDAYWVWYKTSTAGTTTSDTRDWDYVGGAGTHGTTDHLATVAENKDQTIKYWDYSASQYDFVAYSATHTTTVGEETTPKITKYKTSGFTVQATADDLAGLYVADKVTLKASESTNVDLTPTKPASSINKIGGIVQFTFRASASKVRLGIYETIPGYEVKNIKFLPLASEFTEATGEAMLCGSFNGTSKTASGTYNVIYNSTTGVAEFDNTAESPNEYFDFGTFVTTAIGVTSTSPTWASGSYAYQNVLPNTDNVGNMTLYVDYELYNATSGETIHVYGAKAVVPSIYMKWNPNYAYTYLFKISDNTNGQTLAGEGKPVGLYPITFDAVTIAATDGQEVGTITTVSTPAITTYQEGSVVDKEVAGPPAESKHGITYAASGKPIYITVNTDGTPVALTDNIALYTVDAGTTEADLLLGVTTKHKTAVSSGSANALSILSTAETLQGIVFASGTTAKFTPAAGTTYAVEYLVSAAEAASYSVASVNEGDSVSGLFELDGSEYKSTEDTVALSGKTYYSYSPAVPAVYQYKIIEVASGS